MLINHKKKLYLKILCARVCVVIKRKIQKLEFKYKHNYLVKNLFKNKFKTLLSICI